MRTEMKTSKYWATSLLVAALAGSCTHQEEPLAAHVRQAIEVSAGIGEATRAAIDADYDSDLDIAFARLDEPEAATDWQTPAIDAVRAGGEGNTAIAFTPAQKYVADDKPSALIGFYPRAAIAQKANPATVSYTISGDDDLMATQVLTGKASAPFAAFTFRHLLTQLQIRCSGSAEAIRKWTAIASISAKDVPTALTLSLDKTSGATLASAGTSDQVLAVKNCPKVVATADAANPATGYVLLLPTATMGTASAPIRLEVKATYDGVSKTVIVPVDNIDGGAQAGQSHLLTLTFLLDGTIAATAGIAPWQPGNGGSATVTPGNE